MSDKPALPAPAAAAAKPARGPRPVPPLRIGFFKALFRYAQDSKAPLGGKLFVLLCVGYIVMPIDLIPDVVPILGWLDDIGAAGVALAYLTSVLGPYRDGTKGVPEGEKQLTP